MRLAQRALLPLLLCAALAPLTTGQIDADFTADVTSGTHPLTVSFTDTTTGASGFLVWAWDFGDGKTSGLSDPVHTYTTPGTYTVSLKVSNLLFGQDTETKVDFIDVTPVPLTADFSASATQGTNPLSVTFTDMSTGTPPTAWLWDFGDGGQSTMQNPTYVFGTPGTFDVSLTIFFGLQPDTLVKTDLITIDAAPLVADFTAMPTQGGTPLTVSFTDTSHGSPITAWAWDFGDGNSSTTANPVHVYTVAQSASLDVSLTVWFHGQSASKTSTDLISIDPTPGEFALRNVTPNAPGVIHSEVGDLDSDGDLDVIYAATGGIHWCENLDGLGTFGPSTLIISGSFFGGPNALALDDSDGDGNLDVLALRVDTVSQGYSLSWYENVGPSGTFAGAVDLYNYFEWRAELQVADIDGDGDGDAILSPFEYYIGPDFAVLRNQGDGTFAAPYLVDIPTGTAYLTVYATDTADVDGDGDIDLVASYEYLPAPYWMPTYITSWLENTDGMGTFVPANVITTVGLTGREAEHLEFADLDNDGDLDMVSGGESHALVWSTQTSTPGVFNPKTEFPAASGNDYDDLGLADMDNDGDVDVVVARGTGSGGHVIEWYENLGGANPFTTPALLSSASSTTDTVALGDLDADDDIDVVSSDITAGTVEWYENPVANPFWDTVGPGTPGSAGVPSLMGTGLLKPGSALSLEVSGALASAPTYLIAGLSQLLAPFKGGVLVPQPDVIVSGLLTDPTGGLALNLPWVTDAPAGLTLTLQFWIADAAGPVGYSATNGISRVTQ